MQLFEFSYSNSDLIVPFFNSQILVTMIEKELFGHKYIIYALCKNNSPQNFLLPKETQMIIEISFISELFSRLSLTFFLFLICPSLKKLLIFFRCPFVLYLPLVIFSAPLPPGRFPSYFRWLPECIVYQCNISSS